MLVLIILPVSKQEALRCKSRCFCYLYMESLFFIWFCGFAPGFVNYKKGCTRLAAASDKVYQLLAHGWWFSPGTPSSSTTKTGRHDIAEILLKVALNNKNQSINQSFIWFWWVVLMNSLGKFLSEKWIALLCNYYCFWHYVEIGSKRARIPKFCIFGRHI